jgi:hypothetical protein
MCDEILDKNDLGFMYLFVAYLSTPFQLQKLLEFNNRVISER